MSDGKNNTPFVPISGLALVLAALGISLFTQVPYKGTRPPAPEQRSQSVKVDARLWQDPFSGVLEQVKTNKTGPRATFCLESSCRLNRNITRAAATQPWIDEHEYTKGKKIYEEINDKIKKGEKVTILEVMVSGEPYAEEAEQRIRSRYAVLAGLRRMGFYSSDAEHLEYIRITNDYEIRQVVSDPKPHAESNADIIPIEWLQNSRKDAVLLLWISNTTFKDTPLAKLNLLAKKLSGNIKYDPKSLSLRVIGPAGSTGLKEMLAETGKPFGAYSSLSGMKLFSAIAAVDDSQLLESIGEEQVAAATAKKDVRKRFMNHQISFERTVQTDRELAGHIIEELKRRDVNLSSGKDHILLVAEWDSLYGRSLTDIYKRLLVETKVPNVDRILHRISYLRGIDGSLPGEKKEKKDVKDDKNDTKDNPADSLKKLEEPIGKSQYDYLRRLSQETYYQSKEMKGSIKAIGVLGSDFYDKYLVLQALHQRFPQAIFFTTNLDARHLHPEALQWTRNLIVASNYDLALRKDNLDFQGDVPPFRDCNQTSVFFATMCAFLDDNLDNPVKKLLDKRATRQISELLKPQVFEIGRSTAYKLYPDEDDIHPRRHAHKKAGEIIAKAILILILLLVLLKFTSSRINDYYEALWESIRNHKLASGCIMLLITGFSFWFHNKVILDRNEEPISFFEGISVWPTGSLRLISIILSVLFIVISRKNLIKNRQEIDEKYRLKVNAPHQDEDNFCLKKFWRQIKEMDWKRKDNFSFYWKIDTVGNTCTMHDIWKEYNKRDSFAYRLMRLVPLVIIYLLLSSLIISSFDMPITPVRGEISRRLNTGFLVGCILAFTFLVFYVFDVIRNCRRFIYIASDCTAGDWGGDPIDNSKGNFCSYSPDPFRKLKFIQLIAARTEVVGKLIFYPFIVWFVMFISRINYFDNWQTPIGLAIVTTMSAAYAWSCAFFLRQSAERARDKVLKHLDEKLTEVILRQNDDGMEKKITFAIDEVKNIRTGAFAPFTQHPVVQALLVPFGGVGGVYLLDFFSKLNM